MDTAALDPASARYEVKFLCSSTRYDLIRSWVCNHSRCFYSPYPSRYVNSIYFDDYDLRSYQENLAGISARVKTRLRWYGDIADPVVGFYEMKIKKNRLGWKIREQVALPEKFIEQPCPVLQETFTHQLSQEAALYAALHPFPSTLIRYRREYFVSADQHIRITLDQDVQSFDQQAAFTPNICFNNQELPLLIIEIKAAESDRDVLAETLSSLELVASKSSKYATAIQRSLGD